MCDQTLVRSPVGGGGGEQGNAKDKHSTVGVWGLRELRWGVRLGRRKKTILVM
jgi:hypothetical protein